MHHFLYSAWQLLPSCNSLSLFLMEMFWPASLLPVSLKIEIAPQNIQTEELWRDRWWYWWKWFLPWWPPLELIQKQTLQRKVSSTARKIFRAIRSWKNQLSSQTFRTPNVESHVVWSCFAVGHRLLVVTAYHNDTIQYDDPPHNWRITASLRYFDRRVFLILNSNTRKFLWEHRALLLEYVVCSTRRL